MKSLILILICKPSSDSNPDMDGLPKVTSLDVSLLVYMTVIVFLVNTLAITLASYTYGIPKFSPLKVFATV